MDATKHYFQKIGKQILLKRLTKLHTTESTRFWAIYSHPVLIPIAVTHTFHHRAIWSYITTI